MAKSKKRGQVETPDFDWELVFKADGTVELRNPERVVIWASDADDDFAEEFEGDFFGESDADEILDYLDVQGFVDIENDEIDIVENDLSDEVNDDDIIDGEFTVKQ